MAPTMLSNLQRCADFVADELHKGTPAAQIIEQMKVHFGARWRDIGYTGFELRACSVVARCTGSRDIGLLAAWRRNATVKIMRERAK